MSPARRDRDTALAFLTLAAVSAAGVFLLLRLAVHTAAGQRLDERLRGGVDADDIHLTAAGGDLLDTVSVTSLALAVALVMAAALMRRRPRLAVGVGVMILGANLTTQAMKAQLDRPRLTDAWWDGAGSFPSGHATVAMSLAMALVLVAPPALRLPVTVVAGTYALGVGVAVIALDWHRPSDVLGAQMVVTAWTGLIAAALALWPDPTAVPGRDARRRARVWGLLLAALPVAILVVAAVRAAGEPEVGHVVTSRTGLVAAGAVCIAAGAAMIGTVAALSARRAPAPRRPARAR